MLSWAPIFPVSGSLVDTPSSRDDGSPGTMNIPPLSVIAPRPVIPWPAFATTTTTPCSGTPPSSVTAPRRTPVVWPQATPGMSRQTTAPAANTADPGFRRTISDPYVEGILHYTDEP